MRGGGARRWLGDPQPQAGGLGVPFGQLRFPCRVILEQARGQLGEFGAGYGGERWKAERRGERTPLR